MPADPHENLAREIVREALRLPERQRIWVFERLREDLASARSKPREADQINQRMRQAAQALKRAAEHLNLTGEQERLALTIRAYDQIPEKIREGWSAKRVRGAFIGSWELAKGVAFTDMRLPVATALKAKRRKALGQKPRSNAFAINSLCEWLAQNPATKTVSAYDQWRQQHNRELPDGRRPAPTKEAIRAHWQGPWSEIVLAAEEDRLPAKREPGRAKQNRGRTKAGRAVP